MPLLDAIRERLMDVNVVEGTTDFRCSLGQLPPEPHRVVALNEYAGAAPGASDGVERPSFQALVRGVPFDYITARLKAWEVMAGLHGCGDVTLDGEAYIGIWANASPALLYRDKLNRPVFAVNFRVQKAITQ